MPRDGEMIWCDKCGIFVSPADRKPETHERAAEILTDDEVICVKCAARHGITAATYAPAQTPPPAVPEHAPAVVVPQDPAQTALDALPTWIKEDGARHGRNRLKAAVAEAERLTAPAPKPAPAPLPAPPRPESWTFTPPAISPEQEELAYSGSTALLDLMETRPVAELQWPEGQTLPPVDEAPATEPTPADRDTKEAPKPTRPVRRPARPRRELPAAALAALAPASDTDDAVAVERIRDESVGAPAPRPWAQEMPGPAAPAAKPAPQPAPRPARTPEESARLRRELALAYAEKHGTDMAPPSRRPIVTAQEIRSGMRQIPEAEDEGPLEYHPDVYLKQHEAARYLGRAVATLARWRSAGEGPAHIEDNGLPFYRVSDLDAFRAQITRPAPPKPKKAPSPGVVPRADRIAKLAQLLEQGQDLKTAVAGAGFKHMSTARNAVRDAGRDDLHEVFAAAGRQALIDSGRARAEEQRQQATARLDRFVELIGAGTPHDAAAQQAEYADVQSVRVAARRIGRTDVLALIPNRRGVGHTVSTATRRTSSAEKLEALAKLLQSGTPPKAAAIEAGYARVAEARNSARRFGRQDIVALMPDGRKKTTTTEEPAAQDRAA